MYLIYLFDRNNMENCLFCFIENQFFDMKYGDICVFYENILQLLHKNINFLIDSLKYVTKSKLILIINYSSLFIDANKFIIF